jgi:anti-sigma factor RsiW
MDTPRTRRRIAMTPHSTGDFSRALCDERHDRLDVTLADLGRKVDSVLERIAAVREEVVTLRAQEETRARETERSRGFMWRVLPWLIAALLGGGGTATIVRSALQETVPAAEVPADRR